MGETKRTGSVKMEMENLKRASQVLETADALLICAGAGIGVDSGLPDFRGNQGFWKAYPAIGRMGKSFVEMANPRWFHLKPELAWAFYGHRLNLYRRTNPHRGFSHLLSVANRKKGGYFVFTSNVDGQFQKAGFDDRLIEECHGSIHHLQCSHPCNNDIWDAKGIDVFVDEDVFEAREPLPRCPHCGGIARPNVLMFGDWSWNAKRTETQRKHFDQWLCDISAKGVRLCVVEVGAGDAVRTVRNLSERVSKNYDIPLIRINPRDWTVPRSQDIPIPMSALEAMEKIVEIMGSL